MSSPFYPDTSIPLLHSKTEHLVTPDGQSYTYVSSGRSRRPRAHPIVSWEDNRKAPDTKVLSRPINTLREIYVLKSMAYVALPTVTGTILTPEEAQARFWWLR